MNFIREYSRFFHRRNVSLVKFECCADVKIPRCFIFFFISSTRRSDQTTQEKDEEEKKAKRKRKSYEEKINKSTSTDILCAQNLIRLRFDGCNESLLNRTFGFAMTDEINGTHFDFCSFELSFFPRFLFT